MSRPFRRLFRRLRIFAASLGGRIALILAVGICLAAFGAVAASEQARRIDIRRIRAERVVASAVDVITRLERDRGGAEPSLGKAGLSGAHVLAGAPRGRHDPDPYLTDLVAGRVAPVLRPTLAQVPSTVCTANDPFWSRPRAAGFKIPSTPDCWLLAVDRPPVGRRYFALDLPRLPTPPSSIVNPLFLGLVLAASALLSLIVARLATAPLRRLAKASQAFARSIDAEPVPETGPADVRRALATFNLMQERVREGLRERTRLLAAISHDLQTPLTRLRLRLEQVEDEALRDRLIADLSTTLAMVRRGLDLARSSESAEDWSTIDLDSMLSSMAEDAAEFGQDVRFLTGCGARVRVKPDALSRCLTNLIDNAVKYAGGAEIACREVGGEVAIEVRDHGPGMASELIARAFAPFVRGQGIGGAEGTGIGLTIARAQAAAIGGELSLRNHAEGGLSATLRLPAARR